MEGGFGEVDFEAEMILSMPISPMSANDRLIWDVTKDVKFLDKSAYHMQQQARRQREGETSEGGREVLYGSKYGSWGFQGL